MLDQSLSENIAGEDKITLSPSARAYLSTGNILTYGLFK